MKFLLVAVLVTAVVGDLYLLGPRGSNNRLNEQGRERNNANRFVQIKIQSSFSVLLLAIF